MAHAAIEPAGDLAALAELGRVDLCRAEEEREEAAEKQEESDMLVIVDEGRLRIPRDMRHEEFYRPAERDRTLK